ncbi:MAG: T9SS type A sorting domain-containing protein, partial [Ignavibacteria bacterium]|nr:T9SS type A sorting domain-containing protein [Ignavibacteria bacterium]
NGGLNWFSQTIPSGVTSGYVSIKFINGTSTAYLINSSASATITAKSTDYGATWTTIAPVAGVNGITHMEYIRVGQTVYLYAISSSGAVMKLVDNVLVGVENNNNIPTEYKLEQNYPNPFNPTTTISFSLPKSAFVTIKVYDVLGKEIRTILSENKDAGNHSLLFDATDLPSGIYYYKIVANNFVDTKKMILLK